MSSIGIMQLQPVVAFPAEFPININRPTLQGLIRFIGYSFILWEGGNSVNVSNLFIASFFFRTFCFLPNRPVKAICQHISQLQNFYDSLRMFVFFFFNNSELLIGSTSLFQFLLNKNIYNYNLARRIRKFDLFWHLKLKKYFFYSDLSIPTLLL